MYLDTAIRCKGYVASLYTVHPTRGRGLVGQVLQMARGCNLRYALFVIGLGQGSVLGVRENFFWQGVSITWPCRGTTLVICEQKSGAVLLDAILLPVTGVRPVMGHSRSC